MRLVDAADPQESPGRVIVRVHACSLNYRDLMVANNEYGPGLPKNLVPLSDCAGEIVSVGADVTEWKPGDRVVAGFFEGWESGPFQAEYGMTAFGGAIQGVLSEYRSFATQCLVRIPDRFSYEEAACFPCAGVTAWHALQHRAVLGSGESCLLMGTGGVAVFGLQIAKFLGARPVVLSAHVWKQDRAKEIGAVAAIDYSQVAEWDKEVVGLTGEGVDVTLETVGATTLERSMKATRAGGSIALVGRLDRSSDETRPFRLAMRNQSLYGIYVGSAAMLSEVIQTFAEHKTKPVVDRVFSFEEARKAYHHLTSQNHFGKVVIRVSS